MPRLLPLCPWLGLAFLAGAGVACLNPQPEPPTESASTAGPPDRGSPNTPGAAGDDDDTDTGKGNSGGGGAQSGGIGANPPPDPGDSAGGSDGEFGVGAAGTTASNGGGGSDGVTPPQGAAGAGGNGGTSPDVPGGGAGGAGGSTQGEDTGDCGTCRDVLERGGTPCPGAVAKLTMLVSCCHEACGACKERIIRGDRVGHACTSCLAGGCAEAWKACADD